MPVVDQVLLVGQPGNTNEGRNLEEVVASSIRINGEKRIVAVRGHLHEILDELREWVVLREQIGQVDRIVVVDGKAVDFVDVVEGRCGFEDEGICPRATEELVETILAVEKIVA